MQWNSKICVSLANIPFDHCVDALRKYPLAELRMDLLNYSHNQYQQLFSVHPTLIATCRPGKLDEGQRLNLLLKSLEWGAAYVDIEVETPNLWIEKITRQANILQKKLILSYHNFTETPSLDLLEQMVHSMFKSGAQLAKLACMANDYEDNARLLSLYAHFQDLISIGMGEKGVITRISAPLLGAPFTYASYNGNHSAPGQLDVDQMESLLSQFS